MPTWVYDREKGKLVDKDKFYHDKYWSGVHAQSDLPMPYVRGDLPTYISPVTGKPVEGRAARREDLARSGCREVDPSERPKDGYTNYEFCQRRRLPYRNGDIPPPMTKDEFMWSQEKSLKAKAAEKAATSGPEKTDPDLPKYLRINPKAADGFDGSPKSVPATLLKPKD